MVRTAVPHSPFVVVFFQIYVAKKSGKMPICTGVTSGFHVYSLNIDLGASGVWCLESAQKNNQFLKNF